MTYAWTRWCGVCMHAGSAGGAKVVRLPFNIIDRISRKLSHAAGTQRHGSKVLTTVGNRLRQVVIRRHVTEASRVIDSWLIPKL